MSNPPDKYVAVPKTGNVTNDLAAINAQADQGYRVSKSQPLLPDAVLMDNYQEQNQ